MPERIFGHYFLRKCGYFLVEVFIKYVLFIVRFGLLTTQTHQLFYFFEFNCLTDTRKNSLIRSVVRQ